MRRIYATVLLLLLAPIFLQNIATLCDGVPDAGHGTTQANNWKQAPEALPELWARQYRIASAVVY